MKKFKDLRIRTKLLTAYILVIVLSMAFFSITVFRSSSKAMRNDSLFNVGQTVSLARDNTLSYMDDIENTLFTVQANEMIQSFLANGEQNPMEEISAIENELLSIDIFRRKLTSIRLYVLNRPNYQQNGSSMVLTSTPVSQEPWYIQTVDSKGQVCWNVFHAQETKGTIAASRLIINTSTHQPVAVVRADIDILQFVGNMDNIKLGKQGKVFLVAGNHIVNLDSSSYVKDFVNNRAFFDLINNETISDGYLKIDGTEYLVNYGNLKTRDIKIVGGVKSAELDDSIRLIAKAILITALISTLIAFILLLLISNYITIPLYKLANIMKNYGRHTGLQLEVPSNDEIGMLYKSYNTMVSTIDNLITDVNMLYQKQKVSELKALQAQINPHFLYNTLDSINWMAKKYQANDIRMITTALASFFRHSLNKGKEYTTIENELKQIENYVYIQKVRFRDQFDMIIDVAQEVLPYSIVKLSLQPLVENCIVHAFEDMDRPGLIQVEGYREEDFIFLKVIDNGCGADVGELNRAIQKEFNPDEPIEKYGIHNVNQRIKLYFGPESGLRFSSNESGGVTAIVRMEVKEI